MTLTLPQIKNRCRVDESTGCWIWQNTVKNGYPCYGKGGRVRITKLVWELANSRPFPTHLYACHLCNTRSCANPDHIIAGSQQFNIRHAVTAGLVVVEFDAAQVAEIRKEYATTSCTYRSLAAKYQVNPTTIMNVVRGKHHYAQYPKEEAAA